MDETRRFIVTGRVQGVGFRAATCDHARRLGLSGWVCNRPNGAVETLAAGDEHAITELHAWLHDGPPAARVDHVESCPADTADLPEPFAIR